MNEYKFVFEKYFCDSIIEELIFNYENYDISKNLLHKIYDEILNNINDKKLINICNTISNSFFPDEFNIEKLIKYSAKNIFKLINKKRIIKNTYNTINIIGLNLRITSKNYFYNQLPCELKNINNIVDPEIVREKYIIIKSKIEKNLYSAYWIYPNIVYEEIRLLKIRKKYIKELRSFVINQLKSLEELTAYKDIIKILIDVLPVNKSTILNESYTDYIDEWELYYYDKPSIHNQINRIINFKYSNNENILASEYLFLFHNKKLTPFGYDHLYDVIDEMEILLKKKEKKENQSLINKYSNKYDSEKSRYLSEYIPKDIKCNVFWFYYKMKLFEKEINELSRLAENIVRDKYDIPRVDEGWVSEMKLYNEIKDYVKGRKVFHHARLNFLGKQHLDIFIPSLNVAIEYQGLQHYEPVDFFGGEEAFKKTQERDIKKFKLCKENGIKIVYVREGYNFEEVIKEIKDNKNDY